MLSPEPRPKHRPGKRRHPEKKPLPKPEGKKAVDKDAFNPLAKRDYHDGDAGDPQRTGPGT